MYIFSHYKTTPFPLSLHKNQNMKFSTYALTAVAAVTIFASCKKDDSSGSNSRRDMIIGKWEQTFDADDDNNNKTLDASEKVATSAPRPTSEFKADGTGTGSLAGVTIPITWQLIDNEQKLVINIPGFGADTGRILSLVGNDVVLEYVDGTDYSWSGFTKK